MKPKSFMLIAGEASGDLLAAELVAALRARVLRDSSGPTDDVQPLRTELAPHFFGAGGPHMQAAGVELAFDMTQHSVIGIFEVFRKLLQFRRLFQQLLKLAIERQPDAIIGVDYGGFNLRFGNAIKNYVRKHRKEFTPWNPKLVQFVSPQVWASRPGRAYTLAENYDLLLSIFPFEKQWYGKRVPKLHVEFVGHPMIERFRSTESLECGGSTPLAPSGGLVGQTGPRAAARDQTMPHDSAGDQSPPSKVVLLPGSRGNEVRRHWPVVTGAFELLRRELPTLRGRLVLPDEASAQSAKLFGVPEGLEVQVGGLAAALGEADLAITKSGTITMECALFGVPAVVFYKTSWPTYFIGRQIVGVKYLAMPNLLAGGEIFPEFVQQSATPENISRAALELLRDQTRRQAVKARLSQVLASLGGPGAIGRAAKAIVSLLP